MEKGGRMEILGGEGGLIETKSGGCYLFNTANTSAIYC